jgi:uncharacterized protein (TIRG00374 family)
MVEIASPSTPAILSGAKRRRLEYGIILSIVGFAALVAAGSIYAGYDKVIGHIRSLPFGLIALMLGLSLVNYGLRVWRWHHLTLGIGAGVSFGRNTLYYFSGFALTTTPGKAGEALRVWFLERAHGVPYERGAPMFIGDRLADMVAYMFLTMIGSIAFIGTPYAPIGIGFMVVGCTVLGLLARPRIILFLINWGWGLISRRLPRLIAKLRRTVRTMSELMTFRTFGFAAFLGWVGWAAEVVAFWALLEALGAEVSFLQAMFVFAFSVTAGALVLLPGGLGGTEGAMIGLLSLIGVEFGVAVAATAVIRLTTLWFAMALGVLPLVYTMRLMRRIGDARAQAAEAKV